MRTASLTAQLEATMSKRRKSSYASPVHREAVIIARERNARWNSKNLLLVAHPIYGEVIVPGDSPLSAIDSAAEVWGCSVDDIKGAAVKAAPLGAVSAPPPRIVLLYKGVKMNIKSGK